MSIKIYQDALDTLCQQVDNFGTYQPLCVTCKQNPTGVYQSLCDQHASESGFRIGISTIPNAGMGLFTLHDLEKGDLIGVYGGIVQTKTAGDYCLDLHRDAIVRVRDEQSIFELDNSNVYTIDAADTKRSTYVRYINDARNKKQTNVAFAWFEFASADSTVMIKLPVVIAQRSISTGKELFIDYGLHYWSAIPPRAGQSCDVNLPKCPT
jgi:hypothetical protein